MLRCLLEITDLPGGVTLCLGSFAANSELYTNTHIAAALNGYKKNNKKKLAAGFEGRPLTNKTPSPSCTSTAQMECWEGRPVFGSQMKKCLATKMNDCLLCKCTDSWVDLIELN